MHFPVAGNLFLREKEENIRDALAIGPDFVYTEGEKTRKREKTEKSDVSLR